jgi:hypothetical protein
VSMSVTLELSGLLEASHIGQQAASEYLHVANIRAASLEPEPQHIQAAVSNQSRSSQRVHRAAWVSHPEPAFNSTALRMACQAAYPDINAFTDDGSSRGRVAQYNIAMHRVAMLRLSASCTRSEVPERNGTTTWTMHCQSASCVLELWVGYSSSLHGRRELSARTGVLRVTTHGPKYHHLICSWATLLSACRPADPASTRHLR